MRTTLILETGHWRPSTGHAFAKQNSWRAVIMLATLALLCINLNGLHAQGNAEYYFTPPDVGQLDGDSWNSDPVPVMSMDCLAANGIGQWTLSSGINGGYGKGWYLLENALRKPSTTLAGFSPGCVPPGVVAFGSIGAYYPTEPKVTANLDEGVNYVWPEPTLRKSFTLLGFGPGFSSTDIDISLTGIPNPASTRQIVKNGIHPLSIPTWTTSPTNTHDVFTETDYRDEFDVASDAAFTYIIWASTINPVNPGKKEIWVTALPLGSNVPATGFPKFVGDGERPTIACDPRHNRTGTPTPFFDLAYITAHTAGGIIQWEHYNGTSFVSLAATNKFINPISGVLTPFLYPLHVRAEVSSVAGGPWHSALFAIVYANGPTLIMYNIDNPNIPISLAAYVDGALLNTSLPNPIHTGVGPFYVVDKPIIAFANPYDNQSTWYQYDQFHCMYQLDAIDIHGTHWHPIMIVRGSDIAASFPTSPDATNPDTRLVINQKQTPPFGILEADPSTSTSGIPNYVGAVNQMGIHVHWRTGAVGTGTHFYARDAGNTAGTRPKHTFDEDIDENTLVTALCQVGDGTSHGGTLGAKIKDGYRMTLWSDPNYGYSATDINAGFYQVPNSGVTAVDPATLDFHGDYVTLLVGNGNTGATLAVMPNFQFLFERNGDQSNEGVTVQAGSTFDFYGLNATRDATGTIVSMVPEFTDTPGDEDGSGTISLLGNSTSAAFLRVHGGADFHIFGDGLFNSGNHAASQNANIDIEYEPNIYPITASGSLNAMVSGIATFEGLATIQNTLTTGHFPAYVGTGSPAQNYIIHVLATDQDEPGYESTNQYLSSYSTYQNAPSSGLSEIRFDGDYVQVIGGAIVDYLHCTFDHDILNSVEITAVNPQNNFDVTNSTFAGTSEKAISIVHTFLTSAGTYGNMYIANNTFNDAASTASGDVYFNGFNTQAISKITVEDNAFNAGFHDWDPDFVAIDFEGADGAIVGNTIKGEFHTGIQDIGDATAHLNDGTFICSNIVTNSSSYSPFIGAYTSYYNGYVKLNALSYAIDYGYWHYLDGPPHLVGNNIFDNGLTGILAEGTVDMSGVHHTGGTGDIAGYNSVHDNGISQITINQTTSTVVDMFVFQGYYFGSPTTWTVAGLNNIYQGASSTIPLITGDADLNHYLDIKNNYWGGVVDPFVSLYIYPNTTYYPGFYYHATAGDAAISSSTGIVCSDGYSAKKGNENPLQSQSFDTCSNAAMLCEQWTTERNYDEAFDTIRWAIMHCYDRADPGQTLGSELSCAGGSTQLSTEAGRLQFRTWILDTVLELRSDDGWFCFSVDALTASYNFENTDIPAALAIEKFLVDNPRCQAYRNQFAFEYANGRKNQIAVWGDTAKNNNMKYFDSTLPSFHMLGLDTLLNFASVHHYDATGPQIILDAHVTANPFESETSVSLSINREAYLHIDVLDLLGRTLPGAGFEGVFEPGSRVVPLKLSSLTSGTYYIRISTANNELRTFKVEKKQ